MQQQSPESYNACVIDYIEDDDSDKSQSCSPSTCSFSENASKEKSDFEIVVEGRPQHVDQIQISRKYLHEYIKLSLLEEDDHPSDLKGDGCTALFSEECNQPVTISVSEENFIAIQDQKYENIVETKHVEDHKHKFDIVYECINFLGMDDEREGQLFNQSQPLEKTTVCNEELNNEEEDGGSQMDVSCCFSNS